jgi:hypothetical protein
MILKHYVLQVYDHRLIDFDLLLSIIVYHQTHFAPGPDQEYVSMLPLLEEGTGVTHVILAGGKTLSV